MPFITVTDTGKGTDKLYNISYVAGSVYADTFNGAKNGSILGLNSDETKSTANNPFHTEFSGLAGADIVNGAFSTRVSYFFDPNGVTVNLSSSTIKSSDGKIVSGGTALDGFGSTDKLSQIWGVRGSLYSDLINLGSTSEVASGAAGDDTIYGNNGDDDLWGEAGLDLIVGGKGVDIMVGRSFAWQEDSESLPLNEGDVFKFNAVTDSSSTKIKTTDGDSVGDIILDASVDHFCQIDLSAIDANTRIRGNQDFKVDANSYDTFTKKAGQLIFKDAQLTLSSVSGQSNYHAFASDFSKATSSDPNYTQSGVLIQGDIQGDGKADFSIFLVGVSTLDDPDGWVMM